MCGRGTLHLFINLIITYVGQSCWYSMFSNSCRFFLTDQEHFKLVSNETETAV